MRNIDLPEQKIAEFCARWEVVEFALFGSVLTDDFGPESDIDVLVTFSPDAKRTLFDMVDMKDELEAIFGRKVDLLSRRGVESSRNPHRREAILSSAEIIHVSG
ncbi:MAG: nucleotidyltransferase domain-containing protein [Desulfomonile tiedjei]|nr:nucleotidyltransferase domain-containing protein [Desulfomonile tiedjei]